MVHVTPPPSALGFVPRGKGGGASIKASRLLYSTADVQCHIFGMTCSLVKIREWAGEENCSTRPLSTLVVCYFSGHFACGVVSRMCSLCHRPGSWGTFCSWAEGLWTPEPECGVMGGGRVGRWGIGKGFLV